MKLYDIARYVDENISSDSIELTQYITTDNLLPNKGGRSIATNLPPQPCSLTRFQIGDVLIANIRPYLKKVWKADINGGCSKDVLVLRAKEGYDSNYLYALALQDLFFDNAMLGNMGTRMPRGNKNKIMEFPVYKQTNSEIEIGNFVNIIQEKISLNKRINAELEAMAKQLYDYWFVQFDFPDKNGKPYKSSGGKMVWNEKLKRNIPKGWKDVIIADLISEKKAGDWGHDEKNGSYALKVNCIRGTDFKDPTNAPQRFINNRHTNRLLEEDDIVVEISGGSPVQATGRSLYVTKGLLDNYDDGLTCSNFCQALTLYDKTIAPYFFYMWNMFYDNSIMFNYEGKTSGIKNLLIDIFLNNHWYLPPTQLLLDFATTTKSIMSLKDQNIKETNHLTHLRDSLLPMLMNGQVIINQ